MDNTRLPDVNPLADEFFHATVGDSVTIPVVYYDTLQEIAAKYRLIVRACKVARPYALDDYVKFIVGPDALEPEEGDAPDAQ